MQFSPELREAVLAGEITVSIRLWSRLQVKVGGRYPVATGWFEVDSIEQIPFSAVTPSDVEAAGEADLESLRRRAAHSGPIADDTLVYRIELHVTDPG